MGVEVGGYPNLGGGAQFSHEKGCLCDSCTQTRAQWRQRGMEPPLEVQEKLDAGRERTEILSDAQLRATWAEVMDEIAAGEAGEAGEEGLDDAGPLV